MAVRPVPIPFDRERYRAAAAHYERGRIAYAPALIRRVAEATGLTGNHRVLDLGCGPAPLARLLAPLVAEVVAMDPTPEMLAAARTLAAGKPNIRCVAGGSSDLGPELGVFHLVVMGRSFHWMDRVETLRRLDRMIEPGGAIALFFDRMAAVPANAWCKTWDEIRARYEPNAGPHQSDSNWIRHEAVLLDSPFCRLEEFAVIERRAVDVETLVHRALSMGSTSPSHLGTKMGAMTGEMRAALADVREEVVQTSALVAWRA
jgi:SAM-dependent methyltransferase